MLEAREVLIVDALEARWVPLRRMLESEGAIVYVVENLAKVRDAASQYLPALMCVEAEEGSFAQWLESRLGDPLLRNIPVLAFSGGVCTHERHRLHESWQSLGVSDVLLRPHRVSHVLSQCAAALIEHERLLLASGEPAHLLLNGALTGLHESEVELELPLPFRLDQGLELEAQWLEPLGLKSMMIQTLGESPSSALGTTSIKRARLIGDTRKVSSRMDRLWNWKLT